MWQNPVISKLRAVTEPQEPGNATPRIVSQINITSPWWSFGKTPTLKDCYSHSHMWRLPSVLPPFLLYFYPPKCSCFPVSLQSKLLGDREDGGTLTGRFSPITEAPGSGLVSRTNHLATDGDWDSMYWDQTMWDRACGADAFLSAVHLSVLTTYQYYDAAWLITYLL